MCTQALQPPRPVSDLSTELGNRIDPNTAWFEILKGEKGKRKKNIIVNLHSGEVPATEHDDQFRSSAITVLELFFGFVNDS